MSSQQVRVNSVATTLELDHGLRSQTQESTRSQAAIMLTAGHLLHVCVRTHVQDRRDGHVVGDLFPQDSAIIERKQNRNAHDKSPSGRIRIA